MGWHWTPEHTLLTPTAAKRELKALNLLFDELPLIKFADPAITSLIEDGEKVNVGDVIRITRNSVTAGEGFRYYRRVVL